MKKSIVLATAITTVLTSSIASAKIFVNAGFFSNYIWRGVTQTADQASGQGRIDWSHDSGIYAGGCISNFDFDSTTPVDNGYEMDLYTGLAGEAGSIGYDVGVISYQYPILPGMNFTEVYVSGSMVGVTVGAAYTVDKASGITSTAGDDDLYLHAAYDFAVSNIDYSIYAGDYSYDADSSADYTHYGVSMSTEGFSFAVDKNDMAGTLGNVRLTVGYSKDFEL